MRKMPLDSGGFGIHQFGNRCRLKGATSVWVFPSDSPDRPILGTSLAHMHAKVCRPGAGKERRFVFSKEFVRYSLRHTCQTRLRKLVPMRLQ